MIEILTAHFIQIPFPTLTQAGHAVLCRNNGKHHPMNHQYDPLTFPHLTSKPLCQLTGFILLKFYVASLQPSMRI